MSEYGFARASDQVLAVRYELADHVIQALRWAGLPAFRDGEEGTADRSGAVVSVDADAETASACAREGCLAGTNRASEEVRALSMPVAHTYRVLQIASGFGEFGQ
ncbi:hypothetical protein ACWC2T_35625 [Streptomyces sp. NPDC001393]